MTPREFDQLTKSVWSPYLERELEFGFAEGAFFREMPDGTRHVILLDFDVRKAKTFRIIVGFNSTVISPGVSPVEAGVFGVRYLDAVGFCGAPKNFPCFDQDSGRASLLKTLLVVKEVVIPWFDSHQTAQAIAELVEEQYPFIKGKLLLQAGRADAARRYLLQHEKYLRAQPQTDAVVKGMQETAELLKQCAE